VTAVIAPPQGLAGQINARRKIKDKTATVLVWASFGVALVPLIWLLWTVLSRGLGTVLDAGWWTSTQRNITFRTQGGGALHAILGTLIQVALCAIVSVPIAIMVAIYLVEYGTGRLARITTFMVDILTGIPSIVAALFIYAVFITTFGSQRQGLYVSLALVMLMLPVVIRTTEEMLKLVPSELREASYALGIPKWRTITKVVLPTALSGIITGVALGIARVAGETAPLLVLVGYTPDTNLNPTSGFQGTLPGMMYSQVPQLGNVKFTFAADRMWGAALTLIVMVMALNLLGRLAGRFNRISS
jgi:phosphate transport system permease protein